MATPDASRIAVGASLVTGAIFVAPTTTPLPDDGTSELSGYECLGFTSDDGIVISESSSNNSLRVWEGRTEVRNTRTEYTETISFTPVECNAEVAKLLWGSGHVTVDGETGSLKIEHHGQTMDPIHIVIETVPFEGAVARYCSKAQLTERGDMTGNGQDYSGRQATMNCLAVDGVTMTEYVVFTAETEAQAQAEPEPAAEPVRNPVDDEKARDIFLEHKCSRAAMHEAGVTPAFVPIRGGTDGARLSFMGLPCPNLCAGGENAHGRFEYVPLEDMDKCVEILLNIVYGIPAKH